MNFLDNNYIKYSNQLIFGVILFFLEIIFAF